MRRPKALLPALLLLLWLAGCARPGGAPPGPAPGPAAGPGSGPAAESATSPAAAQTPPPPARTGPSPGGDASPPATGPAPPSLQAVYVGEDRQENGWAGGMQWQLPAGAREAVISGRPFGLTLEMNHAGAAAQVQVNVTPAAALREVRTGGPRVIVVLDTDAEQVMVTAAWPGGEPLNFRLRRVAPPVAHMALAGAPHVKFSHFPEDGYPTVPPGPQELLVTFNKPVARASVEAALAQNFEHTMRQSDPSREMDPPPLAFAWQDDQHLTVRFTLPPANPRLGLFAFRLAGAADQEGGRLSDARGLAFDAGRPPWGIWQVAPGQAPVQVGQAACAGPVSPDGRFMACSEKTYAFGDGWETAAWLVRMDGTRRYLGAASDYVMWVADGLLVHGYAAGNPRIIPWAALESPDPAAGALMLPLPEPARVWDLTPEPGGPRVALWLARDEEWPPRLDLYVMDPAGDWRLDDIARGNTGEGYRRRERAAFGAGGALYWIGPRTGDGQEPNWLWRLTRTGRERLVDREVGDGNVMDDVVWTGRELALPGEHLLLDPATGTRQPLPREPQTWPSYGFSPDGSLIARAEAGSVRLYRRSDMAELGRWQGFALGFDQAGALYFAVTTAWE